MHSFIGCTLVGAVVLVVVFLIFGMWRWATTNGVTLGKPLGEHILSGERNIREVSRKISTLVTIPLIKLHQRCEALEEGRIADFDSELKHVERIVQTIIGGYLDAVERTPPRQRLEALEEELTILQHALQTLLNDERLFCIVRMLIEIDECREKLGLECWATDDEFLERTRRLDEAWRELEGSIYDLAEVVRAREDRHRDRRPGEDSVSEDNG